MHVYNSIKNIMNR